MKYEQIPSTVEAFQVPFGITINVPHSTLEVPAGHWIVKESDGNIRVWSDADFSKRYRRVNSTPLFPRENPWMPGKVNDFPDTPVYPWGKRPAIIWYAERTSDNTRS